MNSGLQSGIQRQVLLEFSERERGRLKREDVAAFSNPPRHWERVCPDIGADIENSVARACKLIESLCSGSLKPPEEVDRKIDALGDVQAPVDTMTRHRGRIAFSDKFPRQ